MATAQLQRPPKQRQSIWTETNSTTAVKNLFRTSISQICYLRALFPEKVFSLKHYAEGVPVHALTPGKEIEGSDELEIIDKEAWMLTRWLEDGVFMALEKQYLKSMTFCIYTQPNQSKPRTLVESYSYEVEYPEAGKAQVHLAGSSQGSASDRFAMGRVRAQAISLMRGLVTMCSTLKPLPLSKILDIEVEFYEDITPQKFKMKHFQHAAVGGPMQKKTNRLAKKSLVITVGQLETPFHTLRLKIQCEERKISETMLSQASATTKHRIEASMRKPAQAAQRRSSASAKPEARGLKETQLSATVPLPSEDEDSDATALNSDTDFEPSPKQQRRGMSRRTQIVYNSSS
eukprot:INCI16244.1.p2 GENE.INCI16244.1~~INCI16244.1.p2  ORF type:complete len:346 (-),score=62.88 INCI16244.1:2271-3308(-)